jgi:hypothetical protein
MENGNKPAFGRSDEVLASKIGKGVSEAEYMNATGGLTKREYFAVHMMSGHLASMNPGSMDMGFAEKIAKDSVMAADALLVELDKK